MPIVSILFGLLLIALGVWGRFGGVLGLWEPLGLTAPDHLSATALIPACVGAAMILCGFLAFKERLLKHAMHGAAMVGLLGFAAALGRIVTTGKIQGVGGGSLTAMALLCGVFVALCVNSFIQVRRRRRAAAPKVGP